MALRARLRPAHGLLILCHVCVQEERLEALYVVAVSTMINTLLFRGGYLDDNILFKQECRVIEVGGDLVGAFGVKHVLQSEQALPVGI